MLGVHGDEEVAVWSTATIGGVPLKDALPAASEEVERERLARECKIRSRSIVGAKGAMPFGIGSVVSSICSSILQDKRNVRPVSYFQPEFGCCFSLPAVVGRTGIVQSVPAGLSATEQEAVVRSAKALKRKLDQVQEQF
ncbi:lactate dehydrogenase/glycoside hydrolase [Aspergillus heterothallicus]